MWRRSARAAMKATRSLSFRGRHVLSLANRSVLSQIGPTRSAGRGFAPFSGAPDRNDLMIGAVEGLPHQAVHTGIKDGQQPSVPLLDVLRPRISNSGISGD